MTDTAATDLSSSSIWSQVFSASPTCIRTSRSLRLGTYWIPLQLVGPKFYLFLDTEVQVSSWTCVCRDNPGDGVDLQTLSIKVVRQKWTRVIVSTEIFRQRFNFRVRSTSKMTPIPFLIKIKYRARCDTKDRSRQRKHSIARTRRGAGSNRTHQHGCQKINATPSVPKRLSHCYFGCLKRFHIASTMRQCRTRDVPKFLSEDMQE